MFKKVKNWQLSIMITVISFLSLLVIQQVVVAAWQSPTGNPGDFVAGNIVLNPVTEDIDLQGSLVIDSTLPDDGATKKGTVHATATCCRGGLDRAAVYAESANNANYGLWSVNTQGGPAGYFEGTVGIGESSNPIHSLEISSRVDGINAEINIKSGASDYWAIYNDEFTDDLRFWSETLDDNVLTFDNSGNVEINNGYLQIDTTVLIPPAGDCTENTIGRMVVNVGNNRLYVCSGTVLGGISWKYTDLSGAGF
jgi:hypothetical protein